MKKHSPCGGAFTEDLRNKRSKKASRLGPIVEGKEWGLLCHLFSGGPDEDASSFLETFKRDAARYDWTDLQRIGVFEDALVCEPRRWFRSVNRCGGFKNWKALEKEFMLRWGFDKSSSSRNNHWACLDSESSDTSSGDSDSSSEGLHYSVPPRYETPYPPRHHMNPTADNAATFSRLDGPKSSYEPFVLSISDSDSGSSSSFSDSDDPTEANGHQMPPFDGVGASSWNMDQGENMIFRGMDGNPQLRVASPSIANITDFISTLD